MEFFSHELTSSARTNTPSATFTDETTGEEEDIAGCKDAPFYSTKGNETFAVWYADWFQPAKYVNRAAPCTY
jgi:hypothetical protein